MVILQLPEAAREPELSELLSESTEFADAAQQWECEKAELVNALKRSHAKLGKIVNWLDGNAAILETAAARHERFKSVADEELANAKNYRATSVDIRKLLTADGPVIRKYEAPQ